MIGTYRLIIVKNTVNSMVYWLILDTADENLTALVDQ